MADGNVAAIPPARVCEGWKTPDAGSPIDDSRRFLTTIAKGNPAPSLHA